jgi:hypothetical protein
MSDEVNNNFDFATDSSNVPPANGYFENELNYLKRRRKDIAKDLSNIDETIRLAEELCQKIIVQNGSDYWVWDRILGRYHEFGNLVCWVNYRNLRSLPLKYSKYEWYFTNSHPLQDTIITVTDSLSIDSLKAVCRQADKLLYYYNERKKKPL